MLVTLICNLKSICPESEQSAIKRKKLAVNRQAQQKIIQSTVMEANTSRSRHKQKERTSRSSISELEGQVPDAPKLEDFTLLTNENQHSEELPQDNIDKPQLSSDDTALRTLDSKKAEKEVFKSKVSSKEETKIAAAVESVADVNVRVDVSEENLNETSEIITSSREEKVIVEDDESVDPCEEALPSAPVPNDSNIETGKESFGLEQQKQYLYPTLESFKEGAEDLGASLIQSPQATSMISTPLAATTYVDVVSQVHPVEFSVSQIEELYSNLILENNEGKIKEFLKTTKTSYDGFELYELLCNYMRACNQLANCEKTLNSLREKCTDYEKQLWTISSESLSQSDVCEDGNQVVATQKFLVSNFSKQVYTQIDRTLKEIKELIKESFSLYTYSVELSKAQIKHFFHKSFKDINLQSFEVQGYYSEYPTIDILNCANLLRLCISTLFIFIRRPVVDPKFLRDCQNWIADSVGLLLRIATLSDHVFILNHVVRCPAGVIGKQLAKCVQVPKIPIPISPSEYCNSHSVFGHLNLDYALTVLSTILNPVSKRDEFLKQAEVGVKIQSSPEVNSQWVVVDSDGEDDPEDVAFFKENDLISLLHQIPFGDIFRRILLVYKTEGTDTYNVHISTERSVLKLLAFGTQLVSILGQGFVSYYTDRYRHLVKMIGQLILHCVQYVTDHIECFRNSNGASHLTPDSLIMKEYDLFFRNAVGVLFSGKNIGTLLFLSAIPYHLISTGMLWHIYCGMTKWSSVDHCNSMVSTYISSEFENELVSMNESDAFHLLTTLSNMAIAREGMEANFIQVVTLHLFQIGFLSTLTRDICSKTARDLLGNLTRKFPQLISVILHTINSKMKILDSFSLYVLKELAFDFWKPTEVDVKLLSHWLLDFPKSSVENQTARFVIESMNWHFDETGKLFVPFDVHYQVALMIMGSHSLVSRNQDKWAWDNIKRLHLHGLDRTNLGHTDLIGILRGLPAFESNSELESVRKGIESKDPLACLLTLYLTPVGHSVPLVCSKGFDLIEIMLQNYKWKPVINSLFFITPLFAESPRALYSHEKFRNILVSIFAADMTYMRMAKNLITSDFPGDVTKFMGGMIATQLNQSARLGATEKNLVCLWVECLTQLENWNKDNNILYVLNILAKFSLTRLECEIFFKDYISQLYKDLPVTNQSGISNLFSWSTPMTTLLPNPSYSEIPYLLYFILSTEMKMENEHGFWKSLCTALNNPKVSLEAAVKKSNSKKFATSSNCLTIYRWAQLALNLPNNHELTFSVWHKFFLRYFHRVSDNQTTHYSCVAGRFFEGMINSSFHKKLKTKLEDLLKFTRENIKSFEQNCSLENASENPIILAERLSEKIKLASAFMLWIEDTTLLQETLYLPALAPQFLPSILLTLMEGEDVDWSNYIDSDVIGKEERDSAREYMNAVERICWVDAGKLRRFCGLHISISSRTDDILKRLNFYDKPVEPPPVPIFEDVLPSTSAVMFIDKRSMQLGLDSHFKNLRNFSHSFAMQISQMMALNCAYWESLPDLYINTPVDMLVNARCQGTVNFEGCSGAARVVFKYTEAKLNENLGHQIHQNRSEYQRLMDEKGTQPPPFEVCVAAVLVEDFITNLVLHFRQCSEQSDDFQKVRQVGHELFYYVTTLVNDETDFYPPARQLLSSLLEVLGREFISVQPDQCRRLVTTCVRNPKLIGALAPHLNLATCNPADLIDIYQRVTNIPKKDIDLAFVILTKFDINYWLKSVKPRLNERSQLIAIIWKALTADGLSPDDEKLMVHGTYRAHLKNMLLYDFPQHYGEILNHLLEGLEQHTVAIPIWYDFCNGLSRDTIRFCNGMDPFVRKKEIKRFSTEGSILNHQELIETAHMLAGYFTKDRLMHGPYGLYSKYRNYVEPLSCFLQMISYGVVASSLKNSKGNLSQKVVEAVWPVIRDLYSPWILPYSQKFIQQNCAQWIQQMNFENSSVLQPWIGADSPLALIFMNDFTDCIMFLIETLPGTSEIFSCLWNFYVENYAQIGVKEHIFGVIHTCFVSIPWTMFWPSFTDVETMCRVVEKFLPVSHSFLSVVFAQLPWMEWITALNPKLVIKGHGMLLNLTIRLANDSVARESPTWVHVMDGAENLINWNYVSPSSLEPILNWFVMSIDPRVVLKLDSTHHMDKALLRLLKTACGYATHEQTHSTPNVSSNATDAGAKRYYFVRSYVRLLICASSKYKNLLGTHAKSFEDAVQEMVGDIVRVARRDGQSKDLFIVHLRELMGLMLNHSLVTISRNAIIEWCNSNSDSPLNFLFAVIEISYGMKVAPYVVVPLIETAVSLSFQHAECTWKLICELSIVNPEELSTFFDVASKDGHYLTLYTLLLNRRQKLVGGGLNSKLLFMDLLKNIKPKESNEESLPLVYGVILNYTVQMCQEHEKASNAEMVEKGVKTFLLSFAQHLNLVGDDKQGWGLLGALGLGKSSQLSIRGRLFAKSLGNFILAQLPTNLPIRIKSDAEGHFAQVLSESTTGTKPHPEVLSCLEKLDGLKINRQYADLIDCIDCAIDFIKEPTHTLLSSDILISKLNSHLFSARYLFQ